MKKLVLIAIMLLVPFTAFALDAMDDSALDEITAQEGVTITFDNVVINQTSADMAWGDADGIGTGTDGGYIYVQQAGSTVTTITNSMTIDVATVQANTTLVVGGVDIDAGTSFVKIGLPSVSQSAAAKTMTLSLSATQAVDNTQVLGTLFQDSGSSSISGDIYIYAH